MGSRKRNERRYKNWQSLPDGGRRYWYDVPGVERGRARYVKIVDADERTLEFFQEIYDDSNKLVEIHRKYPIDTDHEFVEGEDA